MHERDRYGTDPGVVRGLQFISELRAVDRHQHLTRCVDALIDLDHAFVQQIRQHDVEVE